MCILCVCILIHPFTFRFPRCEHKWSTFLNIYTRIQVSKWAALPSQHCTQHPWENFGVVFRASYQTRQVIHLLRAVTGDNGWRKSFQAVSLGPMKFDLPLWKKFWCDYKEVMRIICGLWMGSGSKSFSYNDFLVIPHDVPNSHFTGLVGKEKGISTPRMDSILFVQSWMFFIILELLLLIIIILP